jgi:Ca-activated chloride channel family protein
MVCAAQTAFPQSGETPEFSADVNLVALDVGVTRGNSPVEGLTKDRFTVAVDGRPQTISVFESGSAPVSLVAVFDQSRSMRTSWDAVGRAAQLMINALRAGDELAILTFNEMVFTRFTFQPASPELIHQTTSVLAQTQPDGQTALYDAVLAAVDLLDTAQNERRAVILISDGADSASRQKHSEVLDVLRSHNVSVYSIGLFAVGDRDVNVGVLREMAKAAGGLTLLEADPSKLPASMESLFAALHSRYFLGVVAPTVAGRRTVHKIKVVAADASGTRLRTQHRPEFVTSNSGK